MMKDHRLLLLVLLLLLGSVVHAENGCPPGMIPASGTDINSCVPIPPGYYGNQKQASPQQLPPQWATRWGAIAVDIAKGSLGAVVDMASQETANQAAIAECQAKGGLRCQLENSYSNACAAMIVGDTSLRINSANSLDEAVNLGMQPCIAESKNCHVYYSACSKPVRIQ